MSAQRRSHYQHTLKGKVSCTGVGLHSGLPISITLKPAEEDTGIYFVRTDIRDRNNVVKADYKNVVCTKLGTTIANEDDVQIATIEHLMAALWGCGIDNCVIEMNGAEVPIMDGSSEPFVFLIECAGVKSQQKTRQVIEVLKPVRVEDTDGSYSSLLPGDQFSVSIEIDFKHQVINQQRAKFSFPQFSFKNDLSRARTFGFEHEVAALREMGLARGGSLENAIVVGKEKVLNKEGLRFNDEFVRHKILDCIGDTYLAGAPIKGCIEGYRVGHTINNKLLHAFFADSSAYRLVRLPEMENESAAA